MHLVCPDFGIDSFHLEEEEKSAQGFRSKNRNVLVVNIVWKSGTLDILSAQKRLAAELRADERDLRVQHVDAVRDSSIDGDVAYSLCLRTTSEVLDVLVPAARQRRVNYQSR